MQRRVSRVESGCWAVVIATAGLFGAVASQTRPAAATNPRWLWTHQIGTTSYDAGAAVALDAFGNSYVAGTTASSIAGAAEPNAGGFDAFLSKYDAVGTRIWVHQLGSSAADQGAGVSVDGQGNVYLVGNTASNLPGVPETNLGLRDAFIAKYDTDGTQLWVHQLGTATDDIATAVVSDASGNAFVAGNTAASLPGALEANVGAADAFVARFDSAGNRNWVHQIGSTGADNATGVALGPNATLLLAGDVGGTIAGAADAHVGSSDVFLARYDTNGSRAWVHLLGSSSSDVGGGVAADTAGNVFVTGATLGTVAGSSETNAGNRDALVAKYTAAGSRVWVHQLGSPSNDLASSAAVDASGSVFLAGWSFGTAPGSFDANTGQSDVLVAKYDSNGVRMRVHQLGSTNGTQDQAYGIAVDAASNAHVVGWSQGTLRGSLDVTAGGSDAFIGTLGATAPGAPTAISATAGVRSISVAFSAPVDDGGDAIASYSTTCTSSNGGISGSNSGAASPTVVANLTSGSSYVCRVVAANGVGTSAPSNPTASVVLPTIPGAPTIGTVIASDSVVSVAFAPGGNGGSVVTNFAATCTSTSGGTAAVSGGVSSPIAVGGLTNGKTYSCSVVATNAVGSSAASGQSINVVPAGAPDAATGVSAVATIGAISVAFTVPTNDGGSAILHYTSLCSSSDGGVSAQTVSSNSPAVVAGLSNAKTYVCMVAATNAKGTGAISLPSNAVTLPAIPTAPVIGTATIGNAAILVAFTAAFDGGSSVVQFNAQCASSNGGNPGAVTGSGSPIVVSGLTNGKSYSCTVTATNAVGVSAASAPSNSVTPADVPGVPTTIAAVEIVGGVSVTFSIPASDGGSPITGFSVSCLSSNGGIAAVGTGADAPITVIGLTNGKAYACRVSAMNAVGVGVASAVSNSVVIPTVPSAPNAISATSGIASINVAFIASSDGGRAVTGFVVSCSSADGGAPGAATGSASPVTVAALTNGASYQCRVHAINVVGAGAQSLASNLVVPAGAPDAPTGLVATGGSASITVVFAAAFNGGRAITQYTTTCTSADGGIAGTKNSPSSPAVVTGLTNGKAYSCAVTATNSVGVSAPSILSNLVTPAAVPSAPIGISVTPLIASLRVSFSPPLDDGGSSISGYTIECFSVDGGIVGSTNTASSPAVVAALTAGATYACTVTATNSIGVSAQSVLSNVVQLSALPEAPRIGRAASGNSAIAVAFSPGFDGGEPVSRFDASCMSTDGGIAGNASGIASPITVGLLTNGKSYTCTVTAFNAVGASVASPVSNIVKLADTSTGGLAAFSFGVAVIPPSNALPVHGDFNGDHKADVLWYAAGARGDELWYGTSSGFTVGRPINVNGTYVPIVGDFGGDGRDDVLWYAPGPRPDGMWRGTATGFTSGAPINVNGIYEPVVGDYDGDDRADVIWYGVGATKDALWYGTPLGFRNGSVAIDIDAVPLRGDFDGDGRDDVLWYGAGGATDLLLYGATAGSSSGFVRGPNVRINGTFVPLVGDFDGNGRSDVLWYAVGIAIDSVWLGAPSGFEGGVKINISGAYLPILQDFNGDGRSDVFWYRPGTKSDSLWNGANAGFVSGAAVNVGGVYEPTAADFDGTGTGDILWFSPATRRAPLWHGL